MGNEDTTRLELRTSAPVGPGEARVVVLEGVASGRSFDVENGITIGRAHDVELRLDDTSVSRRHARITRLEDGKYLLEDLRSRNGTLLNDEPVTGRILAFGDRVGVGKSILLFTHHHPLEEQMRRGQRLEAIGELSAGIAHDLNNLLGAVLASVDYLRGLPPARSLSDPDVRECVADIVAATTRGSELTQRLLRFARRGQPGDAPVDVGRLCREVAQLARRTFPRKVRVHIRAEDGLVLMGNHAQLYHALLNLCINARDAMPEGGELHLEAHRRDDSVVVTVRDTGAGMDPRTMERIFEPFFTTKGVDQGSGLGLSSAQATVKSHGGKIEVESSPGGGTAFTLTLPTQAEPAQGRARDTPRDQIDLPRSGPSPVGLVMLVDDDQVLRRSVGRLLRQAGHDLIFAGDGEEAVRLYRAAKRKPDVVLLDLDMPRLSGDQAFAELSRIDPAVRVVFLSGLVTEEHRATLLSRGALDVLLKPCDASTLVRTIATALRPS